MVNVGSARGVAEGAKKTFELPGKRRRIRAFRCYVACACTLPTVGVTNEASAETRHETHRRVLVVTFNALVEQSVEDSCRHKPGCNRNEDSNNL